MPYPWRDGEIIYATDLNGEIENILSQVGTFAVASVAPGAVLGLTLDLRTSTSVRLTWAPNSTGGAPSGYTVQYRPSGTSVWTTLITTPAIQVTVGSLACFSSYDYQVLAQNSIGIASAAQILDVQCRPMICSYAGNGYSGLTATGRFETLLGFRQEMIVDEGAQNNWASFVSDIPYTVNGWYTASNVGAAYRYRLSFSVPLLTQDHNPPTLSWVAGGSFPTTLQATVTVAGQTINVTDPFTTLAAALVAGGFGDSIIRVGWEFNSTGEPWNAALDPANYVHAFRLCVANMRAVSGQSFLFEWCPLIQLGSIDPELCYPGDDVVDIVSLDVYNFIVNSDLNARWQNTVYQRTGLAWLSNFSKAHGKVIGVPEWGTGTGTFGGDDAVFTANMCNWIKVNPVFYASWFDSFDSQGSTVISVNTSMPNAAAAFVAGLGGSRSAADLPAFPSAVASFTLSSPTPTTILVNWVQGPTGGPAEKFIILFRLTGSGAPLIAARIYADGTKTTATLGVGVQGGVTPNAAISPLTQYDVQIIASNRSKNAASAVQSITTIADVAPGLVTGFAAQIIYANSIQLQWVNATTGGVPTSYAINARLTGTTPWTFTATVAGPVTQYLFTGLTQVTGYDFEITPHNTGGYATAATILTDVVTSPLPAAPNPVVGPNGAGPAYIEWISDTQALVAWTPSTYAGTFSGSIAGTTLTVSGPITTPLGSTGLVAIGQALSGAGMEAGTLVLSPLGTNTWTVNNAQSVATTTITAVGGPVQSYTAQYRVTGSGTWNVASNTLLPSATTFVFTGLTASTAYDFEILATNAGGNAAGTLLVGGNTTTLVSGVPGICVVKGANASSSQGINVQFNLPTSGAQPTRFYAAYRLSNISTVAGTVTPGPWALSPYSNVTNYAGVYAVALQPNTQYDLSVTAYNATGYGPRAYPPIMGIFTSPVDSTIPPDPPIYPNILAAYSNAVTITYSPAPTGGTYDSFTVQWSVDNTTWTSVAPTALTTSSVSGLPSATLIYFQVIANGAVLSSNPSTTVSATTTSS